MATTGSQAQQAEDPVIELLLALLVALTGIDRPADAQLTALAEVRVVEVQSVWGHRYLDELNDGSWAGWGEVMAYNAGFDDPAAHAAEQWQGSPEHWAILSDPAYTRIGCAADQAGARWYFVCIVGRPSSVAVAPPPPSKPPPADALPNTAAPARGTPPVVVILGAGLLATATILSRGRERA